MIRSDGLQKPMPPASDSWPLICQFITGEFEDPAAPVAKHNIHYVVNVPATLGDRVMGDLRRTHTCRLTCVSGYF